MNKPNISNHDLLGATVNSGHVSPWGRELVVEGVSVIDDIGRFLELIGPIGDEAVPFFGQELRAQRWFLQCERG
jgi:hypothetical protein